MNKLRMKPRHEESGILSVEVPETSSKTSTDTLGTGSGLRDKIKSIFNRCSILFPELFRSEKHLPVVIVQERMIARGETVTFRTVDYDKLRDQGVLVPLDKSRTIIADGIIKVLAAKHGEKLP